MKIEKRKSAARRGYGRKWKAARRAFLDKHVSCVNAGKRGCDGTATCVDHIKDHHGNAARFWDRKNWQPMCKHCHDVKTAREMHRTKARPARYDVRGVPTDLQHPWRHEQTEEGRR